ncbi:type VII secretion-associated protein [Corynebacterium sp.]|uniref:type VII secretion-associated protein n=1 Tax=Corynebacterium sp. TaxID=1720 RepID=UPI002A90E43C|nr:type VII secretion-associated protein [Corynebacterium sp.]MDY5786422.1 type VII secretion-associated protein [Corynebacterium sp.]
MSTPTLSETPALTITMKGAAVIFEGVSNVYRYDRPGPADVAHHVRSVLGAEPGGAVVHVVGEDDDVDALSRALVGYDITLTAEPLPVVAPDTVEDTSTELRVQRPTPDGRSKDGQRGDGWVIAAAAVVVAALAAGAIWSSLSSRVVADNTAVSQSSAPTSVAPTASTTPRSTQPATPRTVVVERQGLRVELPAGFTIVPDGDMWRATGDDPDFRLQIAVENLYQLPAEQMVAQVVDEVEADPEVELVSNDGTLVHYTQRSADGSVAEWRTWADGGHQLFVGCHTRQEATTVQKATCRMAMESAEFEPAEAG